MKSSREKRGQFVIIAVMLTAIMLVSIGALMYGAVTYYKHEPWEEYSSLIGDIEVNSGRVVELSLAQATSSGGGVSILSENLEKWKKDLMDIYPSNGISLSSSGHQLTLGSEPTAKVPVFTLNIYSIGLEGYKFSVEVSLSLDIWLDSSTSPYNLTALVKSESGEPVTGLGVENFRINDALPESVTPFFHEDLETLVYKIQFEGASPTNAKVTDSRGITAVATVS
jgi:hypothetical protein